MGSVLKTEQDYNRITPDKKSSSAMSKISSRIFCPEAILPSFATLIVGVAVVMGAFVISSNETKANKLRYAQQQEFEARVVNRQEEREDLKGATEILRQPRSDDETLFEKDIRKDALEKVLSLSPFYAGNSIRSSSLREAEERKENLEKVLPRSSSLYSDDDYFADNYTYDY